MTLIEWVLLAASAVIAFAYMGVQRKLDRIKERAERVLEGETWWLPTSMDCPKWNDATIAVSVETEQAAARWLLGVVGD